MPMSESFASRLLPRLTEIAAHFGTPFHIYDERGIWEGGERLKSAFSGIDFNNLYAIKANPNPAVLALMTRLGFGFDCSSIPELLLARRAGAPPERIMFTSNNTSQVEFEAAAAEGGSILNLDDISLVAKVPEPFPEQVCFRYNPGPRRMLFSVIGEPVKAKYGVPHEQILDSYRLAIKRGAKRFGLHTMVISNERDYTCMVETVAMLLDVVRLISDELGIAFAFINMGGGLGIPYKPEQEPIALERLGEEVAGVYRKFQREFGYAPQLLMESGRWVTGAHGVLVASCINQKNSYEQFRGLDASCTSTMMRPAMYYPSGGYHHISVPGRDHQDLEYVNVVGSVCEDADRFAWNRELPKFAEGDLVVIHDTGAHCYPMASNYNGRLRPKELMLHTDNSVELIRREETTDDLFATIKFAPDILTF